MRIMVKRIKWMPTKIFVCEGENAPSDAEVPGTCPGSPGEGERLGDAASGSVVIFFSQNKFWFVQRVQKRVHKKRKSLTKKEPCWTLMDHSAKCLGLFAVFFASIGIFFLVRFHSLQSETLVSTCTVRDFLVTNFSFVGTSCEKPDKAEPLLNFISNVTVYYNFQNTTLENRLCGWVLPKECWSCVPSETTACIKAETFSVGSSESIDNCQSILSPTKPNTLDIGTGLACWINIAAPDKVFIEISNDANLNRRFAITCFVLATVPLSILLCGAWMDYQRAKKFAERPNFLIYE